MKHTTIPFTICLPAIVFILSVLSCGKIKNPNFTYETNPNNLGPTVISFTNTTKQEATEFNWRFGDNETSSDENPVHFYALDGEHSVILEVKKKGKTGITAKSVSVNWSGKFSGTAFCDTSSFSLNIEGKNGKYLFRFSNSTFGSVVLDGTINGKLITIPTQEEVWNSHSYDFSGNGIISGSSTNKTVINMTLSYTNKNYEDDPNKITTVQCTGNLEYNGR